MTKINSQNIISNKKRSFRKRTNQSGQGLVSIIIAGGIGAVMLGFMTDMLVQQGVGQKFLSQKLEINDLTSNLITTFSRASNCTCQFSADANINPNSLNYTSDLKFNSDITNGSQKISVKKLFAGCKSAGNLPLLLAEENQKLPNSSSLIVDKVEFINLKPTLGAPNEWQGQWQISFKTGNQSAVRSVRPVTVTQKVTIDRTIPAESRIVACSGTSSGSGTVDFLAKWSPVQGVLQDSSIYEDPGTRNIGIGTTSPTSTFDVVNSTQGSQARFAGNNASTGGLFISGNGQGGNISGSAFSNGNWIATSPSPVWIGLDSPGTPFSEGAIVFWTAPGSTVGAATTPVPRAIIDSSGNLGIGTSTPSNKLTVSQGDIASSIDNHWNFHRTAAFSNTSSHHGLFIGLRGRGSETSQAYPIAGDTLGGFYGRDSIDGLTQAVNYGGASMNMVATENFTGTTKGTKIVFTTTNNGTAQAGEKMVIQDNGHVGVGTTTPQSLFHVKGTGAGASIKVERDNKVMWLDPNDGGGNSRAQIATDVGMGLGFTVNGPSQTPSMTIAPNGLVGIGTTNPDERLVVYNGSTTGKYTSSGWTHTSDRRLKTDISPLKNSLEKILKLEGVSYRFRSDSNSEKQVGFIAQQVEPIFPEVVKTDKQGIKSMVYANLVAPLVEAVKTLFQKQIETEKNIQKLKKQVSDLSEQEDLAKLLNENKILKLEIESLKRQNDAIKSWICTNNPTANICN